ncbi:hypothetical protein QOZ99_003971, partial [Angulomicrobium amanitiforme]|nr:hypothetical protein [Ancylobacter amanitiformis]
MSDTHSIVPPDALPAVHTPPGKDVAVELVGVH